MVMFIAGFSVMLVAGMATAQMGGLLDEEPVQALETPAEEAEATTTTMADTTATEALPEPTTTTIQPATTTTTEKVTTTTEAVDHDAPTIEILHPVDGQVFETKEVVFEGATEPGARVYAGEYEADVREDGTWRIVLWLAPGQNVATLKAVDDAGNVGSDSVTIVYSAPAEGDGGDKGDHEGDGGKGDEGGDGKEDGADIDFSVSQKYGSCSENPPYDVFFGTGQPGLVVEAGSPYGTGRVEVGKSGQWDMKVFFENAPVGEPFEVVIETSDGDRKVFTFVRTGEEPGDEK
jgi:hypothetical protein